MRYYSKKKMSLREFRANLKNKKYKEFWGEVNKEFVKLKEDMRQFKKRLKWDAKKIRKNLRETNNNLRYIFSLPEDERMRILNTLCAPESEQEK